MSGLGLGAEKAVSASSMKDISWIKGEGGHEPDHCMHRILLPGRGSGEHSLLVD